MVPEINNLEKASLSLLENDINKTILKAIIFDIKDDQSDHSIKWEKQNPPKPDFIVNYKDKQKEIELTSAFRDAKGITSKNKQKRYSISLEKNSLLQNLIDKITYDIKNILLNDDFSIDDNELFPITDVILLNINEGKIIQNTEYINEKNEVKELPNNAKEWLGDKILNSILEKALNNITAFIKKPKEEEILNKYNLTFIFKPIDAKKCEFEITCYKSWPYDLNEEDFSFSLKKTLSSKMKKTYISSNPQLFILIDFNCLFYFAKNGGISFEKSQLLINIISKYEWNKKFSKVVLYHKNYFLVFNKDKKIIEYTYFENNNIWKLTPFEC